MFGEHVYALYYHNKVEIKDFDFCDNCGEIEEFTPVFENMNNGERDCLECKMKQEKENGSPIPNQFIHELHIKSTELKIEYYLESIKSWKDYLAILQSMKLNGEVE